MSIRTQDLVMVALFAALTAVGAFIRIPFPLVPFTLQFLFCAYAGIFLGARLGLYSQLLYVMLGLFGVPIFTQGGGPGYIFQPTFGYLLGFVICSYIIGRFTEKLDEVTFLGLFWPVVLGLMVVYVVGVPYLYIIMNFFLGEAVNVVKALAIGFVPYVLPDIFLSAVVALTGVRVVPVLRDNGYLTVKGKGKNF